MKGIEARRQEQCRGEAGGPPWGAHLVRTCARLLAVAVALVLLPMCRSEGPADQDRAGAEQSSVADKRSQAPPEKVHAGTGIGLVLIPAGSFLMGSPSGEEGRGFPEGPQHEVHISESFWMAKHEVTNEQYGRFLEATSHPKPSFEDHAFAGPDQPVVGVSWHDAVAYCDWAGMQLPTEAQWEYAARAGTTTRYWSGDSEEDLARASWYAENSGNGTMPVGQKPANPWGLHDMHGNVWNWTADWYGDYSSSAVTDPVGPPSGEHRVFRGGSWVDLSLGLRAAIRMWHEPGASGRVLGFRPVLAASPGSGAVAAARTLARPTEDAALVTDEEVRERPWGGGFKEGEKSGPWTTWHSNGQKAWEGTFENGEIRKSTTWYQSGQKAGESEYRNGEQHGGFSTWHKNGQKSGEGSYSEGRVVTSTCWNEDGQEEPCPF